MRRSRPRSSARLGGRAPARHRHGPQLYADLARLAASLACRHPLGFDARSPPAHRGLRAEEALVVGDNEPYDGALAGDTVDRHATGAACHALIEIRQDLIAGEAARRSGPNASRGFSPRSWRRQDLRGPRPYPTRTRERLRRHGSRG